MREIASRISVYFLNPGSDTVAVKNRGQGEEEGGAEVGQREDDQRLIKGEEVRGKESRERTWC